ncbi:MAG: hypothetical protein KKB31_05560 [Nanoarchaeota archaeon]|nr:hypothetical protein [Nanoarchaeota archaeon]
MVTLDFSQCKTVEDVDEVFKKKKSELNMIKDFHKRLNETEEVQER